MRCGVESSEGRRLGQPGLDGRGGKAATASRSASQATPPRDAERNRLRLSGRGDAAARRCEQRAEVLQVDRGAAELQREFGELVGLELTVASAHLGGELADAALDSKLLRLERMRAGVAVRKRALEPCPGLLVVCQRALDQRGELIAERAEVNGRLRGHQSIITLLSAAFMGRLDYFRPA